MGIIKEGGTGRPHIEVLYKDIEYKGNIYDYVNIEK